MDKNTLFKKVKENFKKKRKFWVINYIETRDFYKAYSLSESLLNELTDLFNEEEKEKYSFNRLKIGVMPLNNSYIVQVCYS